jgi:hypothetical protein
MVVDLDGEIMTNTWNKNDIVRIEIEIKANNVTRDVVKHLVRKGRFYLQMEYAEEGTVILSMPNLLQKVTINGRALTEDISYRLFVPKNVMVKIKAGQG